MKRLEEDILQNETKLRDVQHQLQNGERTTNGNHPDGSQRASIDLNKLRGTVGDYFMQIQQMVKQNSNAEDQIRQRQRIWQERLTRITNQYVYLQKFELFDMHM